MLVRGDPSLARAARNAAEVLLDAAAPAHRKKRKAASSR